MGIYSESNSGPEQLHSDLKAGRQRLTESFEYINHTAVQFSVGHLQFLPKLHICLTFVTPMLMDIMVLWIQRCVGW